MSAPSTLRRATAGAAAAVTAALLIPALAQAAPEPVPCVDSGGGHHTCTFYKRGNGITGGAPVRNSRDRRVGFLHQGRNWVVCQAQGRQARRGRYHNNWWGWTEADNGRWGWVNALWAHGGSNNVGFGGTPPCYSDHGVGSILPDSVRPPQRHTRHPGPKPV